MTLKEIRAKRLAKVVIESGGNQSLAARKLGVSPQAIQKALRKPLVQKTMTEILNKEGVTNRFLSKLIKEGCLATKLVLVDTTEVDKNGKTIKSEETVVDFQSRHKFVVTALQLKGHLKQGLVDGDPHLQKTKAVFNLTDEQVQELDFSSMLDYFLNALLNQRR